MADWYAASATFSRVSAACRSTGERMPRPASVFARSLLARASSRLARAFLTDPISSSGGGVSAVLIGPCMPSWARVCRSALSARASASDSSWVQA